MNKLFRCYKKFLVSGVVLLCLISGAFVLRAYSLFPFSAQKIEGQARQATKEEVGFIEWLLRITLAHHEVRDRLNSKNNNLIAEYCHAKVRYTELADSNDRWIEVIKNKRVKEQSKEMTNYLRYIAVLYDQMGRVANTSASKLDYSFYEANAEVVHQIRLLNEKMCDFMEEDYNFKRIVFTNQDRVRFDKLILQLPNAKERKSSEKTNREIDVIDMFIIYLGSQELFNKYDDVEELNS